MHKKFLIVEDHPLYAEALQSVICNSIADVRITHASRLSEAKDAIRRETRGFDLALLDLWLPDTHGFEGLIELRGLFPRLPIVVVSAFADQSVIEKSVVCGAAGFIPKSADKYSILQAIGHVLAGEVSLPNGSLPPESIANIEHVAPTSRLRSLTQQQLRVLQMLCQGLLNKQIAFELDVGETTVKAHVTEILRKLCVCSRTQAVAEVSKLNLSAVLALYVPDDGANAIRCS